MTKQAEKEFRKRMKALDKILTEEVLDKMDEARERGINLTRLFKAELRKVQKQTEGV